MVITHRRVFKRSLKESQWRWWLFVEVSIQPQLSRLLQRPEVDTKQISVLAGAAFCEQQKISYHLKRCHLFLCFQKKKNKKFFSSEWRTWRCRTRIPTGLWPDSELHTSHTALALEEPHGCSYGAALWERDWGGGGEEGEILFYKCITHMYVSKILASINKGRKKKMLVCLLVFDLKVEMAAEPVVERRMLDIASSF